MTYTITVVNNGPTTATAVTLTDTLPTGMTFVASLPSEGTTCGGTATVTCGIGTLSNGANATVQIEVTTSLVGTITNTASVASTETGNLETLIGTATQETAVTLPIDLSVTKSGLPDPSAVGLDLTYTITIANSGPEAATGVALTDTLPGSVTYDSATSLDGTCGQAGGTVTCDLGTINSGANATVTIVVLPTATVTLSKTVSVAGNEIDSNPLNNSDTQDTTVNLTPPTPTPVPQTSGGGSVGSSDTGGGGSSGTPSLVSVGVSLTEGSIDVGGTLQFDALTNFSDNSTQSVTLAVQWSSSNTAVVTITSGGLVTGVGEGTAIITANHLGIIVTATLTVTRPTVQRSNE